MGFSSLIDIIGSTIIGSMLLLILWRVNDATVENTYTYGSELTVQQNLVAAVELLEHDFRKIGYCRDWTQIPTPEESILFADSNSIRFLTDVAVNSDSLEGDGIVDILEYSLGDTSELANTGNPRDRMLYRKVNSDPATSANLGITKFHLMYIDTFGDTIKTYPVSDPREIAQIQIDLVIENSYPMTSYVNPDSVIYNVAFWRQIRMAAKNIRER